MDMLIVPARIRTIAYNIRSDADNLAESAVEVTNSELFKLNRVVPEGVYDAHLGTTDFDYLCTTCLNEKGVCPGHPGHIKLNYPVKDPHMRADLLKWLRVICHSCGNCAVAEIPKVKKPMEEILKKVKRIKNCQWCGFVISKVDVEKHAAYQFNIVKQLDKRVEVVELDNYRIRDILARVTDETAARLGKKYHPSKLIRTIVIVSPTTTRPDMKKVGTGKSSMNDTTALYKHLVNTNNDIQPDEEYSVDKANKLHSLELCYDNLLKGSSTGNDQQKLVTNNAKQPTGIGRRLSGKDGHVRKFLLGKRTTWIVRSVITTDPRIRINEVGVPIAIASRIQIRETVAAFNYDRLNTYFKNGRAVFPGATHIIMADRKKKVSILRIPKDYHLKIGDVIFHDLVDGTPVIMNRQPSLSLSSAGTHRVKIVQTGLTLRLNVSVCNAYNADFDGDQMHMIVFQDIQTRIEVSRMADVSSHMISFQTAAPIFGNYYDSLIGIALLTRSNMRIARKQAMAMFAGVILPKGVRFDKKEYTGREIFSMILPDINYPAKKAAFWNKPYEVFLKYDPRDIEVKISRGKLESGIVDKSTAGQGQSGSIYHIIHNDYGKDAALTAIYNAHQLANNFLYYAGFTSGIADITISKEAIARIDDKIRKNIADSMSVSNKLNTGELIVPRGSEIREYYEGEQLAVLDPGDDFIHPVLESIDFFTNGLAMLIFFKSKGKLPNFISINAAIGSQVVGGRRPPTKLAGRTAPYFYRYEDDPVSSGYVIDSWRKGIRLVCYIFSCMESKQGLINNAMSTGIAGSMMRHMVKNMDSIILDNCRKSMKNLNVIQVLYADTGVDPRRTEKVKLPTIKISDKDMSAYHMKTAAFKKQFHTPGVQKLLDEEYEALLEDRRKYREIFIEQEMFTMGKSLFDNMISSPVNPFRIIEDMLYRHPELATGSLNPERTIVLIREAIRDLGYVYYNDQYKQQKRAIPEFVKKALTLVEIAIRSYLNTYYLTKVGVSDAMLDIILDKIRATMKKSLIDSGTAIGIVASLALGEPVTQFVLESKNKSGGQTRTETSPIVRMKEIYSARTTSQMKNPSMLIRVREEFELDRARVQQIASYIKMMNFETFTTMEQIFEEKFGEPVYPAYQNERKWIDEYLKYNEKPPTNLVRWCIRYELSRDTLFVNSIKLEKIMFELNLQFPEIYFVHTPETAQKIVIRAYMKPSLFKDVSPSLKKVSEVMKKINYCIVRGIDHLINAEVSDMIKTYTDETGAIASKKIFVIRTVGSNLAKILENPYIDPYCTQTNSILEFEKIMGIDAARNKIIAELMGMIDGSLYANCALVADEMTFSGSITGIQKSGLAVREKENIPLRISFQSPLEVIKVAALENIHTKLSGISGPFIVGQPSEVGTTYNKLIMNKKFIKETRAFREENIEELI